MTVRRLALAGITVILLASCQAEEPSPAAPLAARHSASPSPDGAAGPAPSPAATPTLTRSAAPAAQRPAPLLHAAAGGDGDSWKDTGGREYRMGLVNAPEYDECYGSQATAKRRQLTAKGFRAAVYMTDTYGRSVSVVTLPDGTNLNVWLARHGFVNDRYLATYRHENAALASQLDTAFAEARTARAGLWGACASDASDGASGGSTGSTPASCHPDYVTCIPVKGDGSGSGTENDLDCPDIGKLVRLRQVGVDPYRLDADGDGYGCDSYA